MKFLFSVFFFIVLISFLVATIINVPADQSSIQDGINVAVDGDTVLVQPGTYYELINYNGKNITLASLFLTAQDTTYISQTIINGWQVSSVVTFENGESEIAILIGFTITNGFGEYGGGIYCDNSSPSLENVTIANNYALPHGGGIYCESNSNPSLENVIIVDNYAIGFGGGIYCDNSSPSLDNVTIANNSASPHGGGIYCESNSNPSVKNVTIANNSGGFSGGGIFCSYSSPSLENVTITNNYAYFGGGILCQSNSNPSLENVTIVDNSASGFGGGIYCWDDSSPSLVNCIMWNDTPEEVYFHDELGSNTITIAYSDIEGGEAGIETNNNGSVNWLEGNIDTDPLFVDPENGDYHLTENSPCIDAGNPDPIYYDPEDPSNPGYALYPAMGTIINDMGAYGGPNAFAWNPVSVEDNNIIIKPSLCKLYQNYPNPFNPTTTISFSILEESKVEILIYNIKGQKVKTIITAQFDSGVHSVTWNGEDDSNKQVGSGVYFYKLNTGDYQKVKKMILLK